MPWRRGSCKRPHAYSPRKESRAISAKLFVGNLSFQTTEPELREYLGQAGTIVDLYLATDRETGRPRGFAFVTYSSDDEASKAMEKFNGAELGGRRLNVNEAQERPRRPRPMGGGGYGGGGGGYGGGGDYGGGGFDGGFDGGWGGGGGGDYGGGGGGGDYGGGKRKPFKAKGSRRGLRAKKRSL